MSNGETCDAGVGSGSPALEVVCDASSRAPASRPSLHDARGHHVRQIAVRREAHAHLVVK